MGYESGKIYKLQCNDGYFYIGSTINELKIRLNHHKTASKNKLTNLYSHVNIIGWENVQIILLESVVCQNRNQLRRKENEWIKNESNDPKCLNKNKAYIEKSEIQTYKKSYAKEYNNKHKENIRIQKREYRDKNKERIRESSREYYQKNKERIIAQQKEYHIKKKSTLV